MKTIAIIPARGGSKRLPSKNILSFGDVPLLAHSILYAKSNLDFIDEVYVSTDCEDIKSVALQYGAKVIDRPNSISGDSEPTVTVLQHVLENIDSIVDTIVLLQPTNPLRPKELLKEAISKFRLENMDSLFTVCRNHQKFGKIKDSKFFPFNYRIGQRSQDLEPLYFENGLLYIAKASLIKRQILIDKNAFPFIVNHVFSNIDIDTKEEFEYAEYLYKKYLNE